MKKQEGLNEFEVYVGEDLIRILPGSISEHKQQKHLNV